MNKFLSKVSILSTAGMLASGIAFAQIDTSISNTGSDSENTVDIEVTNTFSETISNSAEIENEAEAFSSTGDNESDDNTGGGAVDTGNAEINGDLENEVNSSAVDTYTAIFGDVSGQAAIDTTGSDSGNEIGLDVEQTLEYSLSNGASLFNGLGLFASSGGNSASENTGGGDVKTGNAEIGAELMNTINAASGDSSGSLGDVDLELSIEKTGSDSENSIVADVTQSVAVTVTNSAEVFNGVESFSSTGDNESDDNTGGGKVDTGKAETSTAIANTINAAGSSSSVGLPDVNVEAKIDTTGSDSDNTIGVGVSNSASVDVSNSASVGNGVSSSADSGGNSASENTGGGDVSTGNASVGISISNTVN